VDLAFGLLFGALQPFRELDAAKRSAGSPPLFRAANNGRCIGAALYRLETSLEEGDLRAAAPIMKGFGIATRS
jgi:hypothetical protein